MRALVIANPTASRTSGRTLKVLLSALEHDLKTEVAQTDHRGHAMELARRARLDGLDLVITLGGDGTINEAVNGLLCDGTGPDVPDLGIVPSGNTNVFARNCGIPSDPVEATGALLEAVRSGARRPVGLGQADDRWFIFAAGLGLDADVVRAVEERRARGTKATTGLYVRTALRRFLATPGRRGPGPITLERPGADPLSGLHLVIVTNTDPWTYLGDQAVHLTPRATFEDGLGAVGFGRLGLPRTLKHVFSMVVTGRGPHGRHVVACHDVPEMSLKAGVPVPFHVDGDYLGDRESVVFRAAPKALRLVCEQSNTIG